MNFNHCWCKELILWSSACCCALYWPLCYSGVFYSTFPTKNV